MSNSVDGSVRSFRNNLIELANSREHHITQELQAEINGILSALDSLKLDNMFLANSETWRSQVDPSALHNHQAGLLNVIADGEAMLYELRNNLGRNNISTLQENQIRSIYYVAKQRLRGFVHSIHPYSHKSYVRLENYANELGLRNRFKSIRNEIDNKNEDKLKTWIAWTDKTLPTAPKYNTPNWREHNFGQRHPETETDRYENRASITSKNITGHYYPDTKRFEFPLYQKQETKLQESHNSNNKPASKLHRANTTVGFYQPKNYKIPDDDQDDDANWKKHATEAGINVYFPGTTEQKYQYKPPVKKEYTNFVLNPQPDTTKFNRPFTSAAFYNNNTEYKTRYKFPDANQIDKFPWIKQF